MRTVSVQLHLGRWDTRHRSEILSLKEHWLVDGYFLGVPLARRPKEGILARS